MRPWHKAVAMQEYPRQAKDELQHGEWLQMVESELPFRKRTAQSLMAIAQDERITKAYEDSWRLRYRVNGKRRAQTFHGSEAKAREKLGDLLAAARKGELVAPDKIKLADWIEQWIASGAPGRRKKRVGRRTLERYAELLRCHVVPRLGARPIQQIEPTDIDDLYVKLEPELSPRTVHHVHTVLGACLGTAMRKGKLASNPIARADAPSPGESDHGMVLDADQLLTLVEGFRGLTLFPIVAVAAFTGARRNEILALRWTDLDAATKTLRIEWALEKIKKEAPAFKDPKTERGTRTITIDDDLLALLCAEREKHLRIKAGVPDGAAVNLSLVKLPDDALMFPNSPAAGAFSFTKPRTPVNTTKEFTRKARALGFPQLRLHDLRGTHETLLLDAGVPVHVVAARCGHDPAVLLRTYAKRTRKADTSAAAVIGALSKGVLRK
jgi:integrase